MRLGERLQWPLAVLVLLLLPGCDKPTTPTKTESDAGSPAADVELQATEADEADATGVRVPFADAELFFELNSTDNDLGLQLFLDTDDGWRRVRVLDPGRNEILFMEAERKLAKLGITELRFETAEPSPEEVLALFPPGEYRFRGQTVKGDQLASTRSCRTTFRPRPRSHPPTARWWIRKTPSSNGTHRAPSRSS